MIVYDLKCQEGHGFEAWFQNSAAYDEQVAEGSVRCPLCGTEKVKKALMAPNLARSKKRASLAPENQKMVQMRDSLKELRRQVEAHCDDVGERFPEEARRIHYGESDPRGIYGESSNEDAKALEDEGIAFRRIPWLPRENS